jgi:hypothetical protein
MDLCECEWHLLGIRKNNIDVKISDSGRLPKSQVEESNKGNITFWITLYEKMHVLLLSQDKLSMIWIVYTWLLQRFINMGARLEGKVERVIHASDLALLITEWSITGTEPADGTPINLTGIGTIALRRQSMVIENPWGIE